MDIFFQMPDREANSTFTYKDVLVVGEQKKSYDASRFKADLLQLTRYMELWVFDRSGPYSSGLFDIHDEPDKFARALVGYATMSDDAMGLDTFIEREGGHRHATLEDTNGNETRVMLEELIVRQRAIVCRGTTCYCTRNGHVAKFSWASDKRKPEVDHLKLAGEKGVKGVARVVAHRQITNIADMRKGLEFPKPHPFRDEDVYFRDLPSARRRSNSQKPKLAKEIKEQLSIGKTKPSLCTSTGEDPFENRIYSCLVVSPAGRVISDFKTIKELLQSMRDAIRAHQSLYVTGKILHRDVSSNNIIITKPELADGFKGMLIDLDLAKVRDSGPSGARHQTGTMQFMAVEVLREADHTYRHDLESFFYVLIWMCVRESWTKKQFSRGERPPKESLLRRWEVGSFKYIAAAKEGDMTVNRLEEIMGEFPESLDVVKPLCLRIRSIMFGDTARLNFGTPVGDSDQLYKPLVAAYDDTISEL
ncbi:kinase [Hirsutella rhossiliensis]